MSRWLRAALPRVLVSLLLLLVMAMGMQTSPAAALATADPVIEHLRLRVPAAARDAWLAAERSTWEPWLQAQSGFLGRELLWDPAREEGVLLIRWATREQWKAISETEVERVQLRFEQAALDEQRRRTGTPVAASASRGAGNPFPLLASGELLPVDRTPPAAAPPGAAAESSASEAAPGQPPDRP